MSTDIDSLNLPEDVKYTKTSEWARKEGDVAVIGITDYAQSELSDIVYVEPPEVGDTFEQSGELGVVESVKAASDFYAPVTGEVVETNEKLQDSPELMNKDPYGEGWFVKIKMDDPGQFDGLMDAAAYKEFLKTEGGH
jgi:glycine cleavage system H protein